MQTVIIIKYMIDYTLILNEISTLIDYSAMTEVTDQMPIIEITL